MALFRADPQTAAAGVEYLRAFSWDFLIASFVSGTHGCLSGCGRRTFSMVSGMRSTPAARAPFAYLLSRMMASSPFGVGRAAQPASFVSIMVGGV